MTTSSEDPSKTVITGEHFLGPIAPVSGFRRHVDLDDDAAQLDSGAAARRIADLTSQIDFLDHEVSRYRELVERERISHAKVLSEASLKADRHNDELRRQEREATKAVHASYRKMMADRQIEVDQMLSRLAVEQSEQLAAERIRHEAIVDRERARRETEVDSTRQRVIDELYESHTVSHNTLTHEVSQLRATNDRLQVDLDEHTARSAKAEAAVKDLSLKLQVVTRRVTSANEQRDATIAEVEAQLQTAHDKLEAERQRSAATLADLLERSATIAAEADKARADYAEQQAKADHAAAVAHQQAQADYEALADATDERAQRALTRESELEAEISNLRAKLQTD